MTTPEPRGKMLPDAPGVWKRDGGWLIIVASGERIPFAGFRCDKLNCGFLHDNMRWDDFPTGGWLPASPPLSDDERSELERLRADLAQTLKVLEKTRHAKQCWAINHGRAVDLMDREEKRADAAERRCKAIEDSRDRLFAELAQAREQLKSVQWAIDAKQLGRSFNSMSQQLSAALERAEAAEAERDRLRAALTTLRDFFADTQDIRFRNRFKDTIDAALAPQAEKPQ